MSKYIKSIKGMHDYLPDEVKKWNKVEYLLKQILLNYSYSEIRLPILEKTVLFTRTIGQVTDVIEKEMYSFHDKKGNNITLRPEATAGCVRSVIQNGLLYHQKQRLWYYGPMFRYERPQKGRYRQFYQLGIEVFGLSEPDIELELIMLVSRFWKMLGITNLLTLEINLIGSIESRIKYQEVLKVFLLKHQSILDDDCIRRLHTNPFRILDSKNPRVQQLLMDAPILMNYVDTQSRCNFDKLCYFMKYFNIPYIINHRLIRGLDYYNNTVFEWKTHYLGAQNTICAGGRYDTLIQQLGGISTPAIGLAVGMDRLLLLISTFSKCDKNIFKIDIYICFSLEEIKLSAISLSEEIRNTHEKIKVLLELKPIIFKKILKKIKKYSSKIILFLGKDEIQKRLIRIYDIKNQIIQCVPKVEIMNVIRTILYMK